MLNTVQEVGKRLVKDIGEDKYYNLENIVFAIEAYTVVDKIFYIGYDVPPSNPIWGQFWKYTNPPKSYSSAETVVEVRYAMHLDLVWRRFVVCKELCHSLESDEGTHSASDRSMDRLLSRFALMSAMKPFDTNYSPFEAEGLAEIGAIELLCPLEVRKKVSTKDTRDNLCRDYGIPSFYGEVAFEPKYLEMVESIFESFY